MGKVGSILSEIFISYANEDRQRIRPLAHALEARGWSVFWDPNIPTGKSWRDVLDHELKDARCIVVAWSDQSIVSRWVHEEAEDGRERAILIPVFIDKVLPPLGFRGVQAADLSEWDHTKHSDVLERLLADIDALLGPLHGETSEADQASRVAVEDGGAKEADPADTDHLAESLALHAKPSIAVLPFTNMSGDPEQEYFSDGIAEDIITDLSKFSWLTVVARNSSFSFKGQAIDVRTAAKELGASYVLEGSVRKSGTRVRITAQLIDARDGTHIWAERYNRELDDIFDLQDEMTQSICAAIAPELEQMEIRRALGERPENLDAWDYVLRAKSVAELLNRDSLAEAKRLAERALELQPGYSDALSFLAMFHALDASMGWTGSLEEDAEKAIQLAGEALRGKPGNINALCARGIAESMLGRHNQAVETLRLAVQNNPNYSFGHRVLARVLCYRGDYEDAVREAELALSLSPKDVYLHYSYYSLGFAHFADGNNHEAAKWAGKVIQDYPRFSPAFLTFAVASAELGDIDQAKSTVARFLLLEPDTTIPSILKTLPAKDPELVERYTQALRTAGMPE